LIVDDTSIMTSFLAPWENPLSIDPERQAI